MKKKKKKKKKEEEEEKKEVEEEKKKEVEEIMMILWLFISYELKIRFNDVTYVQEMNLGLLRGRKLTVSETSLFRKQPAACSAIS